MGLLRQPVERKLSALLGARVTVERLNVSLLRGSLEAGGVTVGGGDGKPPLLTVRRLKAELSIGRALQRQIVLKSIVIEGPVLTLERAADGSLNLPRRGAGAVVPEAAPEPSERPGPRPAADDDAGADDVTASAWEFALEKVKLFDGAVHVRFAPMGSGQRPYHLSAERVAAEVEQRAGQVAFFLLAQSLGRRDGDDPVELGELRCEGKLTHVDSLARTAEAGLDARLEAGTAGLLSASVRSRRLAERRFEAEVAAGADVPLLLRLAPNDLPSLAKVRDLRVDGTMRLAMKAVYDPASGLRVPSLSFLATDVAVPPAPRT
jgi:hypothetical protein